MYNNTHKLLSYTKKNPIQSSLLGVFMTFALLGGGFGVLQAVAPNVADALIKGPGCCDALPWPIEPFPILDGGGGGWLGGGGGGGPVLPPAPTCEFSAHPTSIEQGQHSTLTWSTTNAHQVSIVGGTTTLMSAGISGNHQVSPSNTTTYTLTATGQFQTVTCTATVTVTTPPLPTPVCTLSASKLSIAPGEESTLTWTTQHATQATLFVQDTALPLDLNGSMEVTVPETYTLTATGPGGSVECSVTITLIPVVTPPPVCTLDVSKTLIQPGEKATLTWTTEHATSATINQGIGAVALNDSHEVLPSSDTTYTLTATGPGGSVECQREIKVVNIVDPFFCELSIDKTSMQTGSSAKLSWQTGGLASFSINQGIGVVTPTSGGETTISPAAVGTHTYTGTGTTTDGDTVTCQASIQVTGGSGGTPLQCTLNLNKTSMLTGDSAKLSWTTANAVSFTVNQGIGSVTPVSSGEVTVNPAAAGTYTYTGVATNSAGNTVECSATLQVTSGPTGGCVVNCGGGGPISPHVTIDFLKQAGEQPLAFITLSQIPYTGIELGPIGTAVYWTVLIIWSGAVAYLVLFKAIPWVAVRVREVGGSLSDTITASTYTPAMPYTEAYMEQEKTEEVVPEAEEPSYNPEEGFGSLKHDNTLSVDDIVRGLARTSHRAPVGDSVDSQYDEYARTDIPNHAAHTASADTHRFLNALMSGDRETTFALIRRATRNGGRPELLLEQALVLLDEAYRARIEGTKCEEDVRRICAGADTALLEEIIDALSSAVDTTYSRTQTGAKMALTRAHAIIDRG